jgi:tetratricopeptide (TPR) repeat protein
VVGSTSAPSDRDRAILRSFADRIDVYDAGAANNLGVLYFTRGMVDEAAAMFTRALDLDPRMTIAQRNLEISYFTSGYYDRRAQELAVRLAAAPDDRDARWEHGRTCLLLGDVPRALDAFGALLREFPDDIQVIRQVATAELKSGDLEAAERWLAHALDVAPDDPAVLLQRGEVAYHRGLNDVARAALERSVALDPDDADAWYLLGFVRGDLGDQDGAMAARQRAMRLNPSLGRARANLSLERFDARSWQRASEVKAARGLAAPVGPTPMPHYHLALAFRQKGYLAEALKEYRTALQLGEDPDLVTQAIAEVALLRGDMAEAITQYEPLLAKAPGRARYWNERGVALQHLGRHAEALASYERAVDADPHALSARNNLGVAAFHMGDPARAARAFEDVLAVEPSHQRARLNAALLHAREGRHAPALASFRAVIEVEHHHPVAWNGVGLVLTSLERFVQARDAFSRAIEARPGFAEAHYNLGFALSRLGEHDAALRETRRALEIDSFYTPQKFELAVDLEHETPSFEVGSEAPHSGVRDFAFEQAELDQLFDGLAAAPEPQTAAPLAQARVALARGEVAPAHALVRQALAEGGPAADALVVHGETFLLQGMPGEAVERFRQARALEPGRLTAVVGEVRALVAAGRETEAEPLVAWLEGQEGVGVDGYLAMASVHAVAGRGEQAMRWMSRARREAPDTTEVLRAAGLLAQRLGDSPGAVSALRAALETGRAPADTWVELARVLETSGASAEATATLEEACARHPGHVGATLALARLRREDGQANATIHPLAAFLLVHPWELDVLASLAESLVACDRRGDARFAVDRVRRFDPDHGVALFVDGILRTAVFDFAGGIAAWDRLLEMEPDGPHAARARPLRAAAVCRREQLIGAASPQAGTP